MMIEINDVDVLSELLQEHQSNVVINRASDLQCIAKSLDDFFPRAKGARRALYDGDVLKQILSRHGWQIREDPTEDYGVLHQGFLTYAQAASISRGGLQSLIGCEKVTLEEQKTAKDRPTGNASSAAAGESRLWKSRAKGS